MPLPTESITFSSLLTLSGLTFAVWLIATAIRQVWASAPVKLVGLAVSLVLSAVIVAVRGDYSGAVLTAAGVNAFLAFIAYLSAAGVSLTVDALVSRFLRGAEVVAPQGGAARSHWWRTW